MTPTSRRAFLHEYRIKFPVGIDTPASRGAIPQTMAAYGMQGTPTTILIDRNGNIAANVFGQIEDLALGAMIQQSLQRPATATVASTTGDTEPDSGCDGDVCVISS